jgi:CheY-like chemotaxis protein
MAHILLAEDNAALAKVVRYLLEVAGEQVTVAFDGCDAWDRSQQRAFDLVITDYHMPKMSGDDLCRNLRMTVEYQDTPIILMSVGRVVPVESLTDELRLSAFFAKPFSPSQLVEKVQELLSGGLIRSPCSKT